MKIKDIVKTKEQELNSYLIELTEEEMSMIKGGAQNPRHIIREGRSISPLPDYYPHLPWIRRVRRAW